MKTQLGKAAALRALSSRRLLNSKRTPVDNARAPAGAPMVFSCISCGADIIVPESYLHKPKLCDECQAMKDCGWLE